MLSVSNPVMKETLYKLIVFRRVQVALKVGEKLRGV